MQESAGSCPLQKQAAEKVAEKVAARHERNPTHLDTSRGAGCGEKLVVAVKGSGAHHVRRRQTVPPLQIRYHPAHMQHRMRQQNQ